MEFLTEADSNELPNECGHCGEPIAEDKMFCSHRCIMLDIYENGDS